jgi:hypothetical protein
MEEQLLCGVVSSPSQAGVVCLLLCPAGALAPVAVAVGG